tara:strand:- start:199 stop:438 length:240 start_codon:yes stop_codon:yes gene_type:complete
MSVPVDKPAQVTYHLGILSFIIVLYKRILIMRKYTLTDQQDQVLVQMLSFFTDMGLNDDMNADDFDSLFDVIMSNGDSN